MLVNPTEEGSASRTSDNDGYFGFFECDGRCGKTWISPNDMYYCKDCTDRGFDPDCFLNLKEGTLDNNRDCDVSHDFLYIPKREVKPQSQKNPDSVTVGEKVLSLKDWLNSIRKDWGFENMVV